MKRRVAALLATVVGLAVVLMLPSPASASASQLEIAPTGQVSSEGGFVTVSVTYQCALFQPVNIEVQVSQSRGSDLVRGFGILFGSCSSSPQTTLFIVQPRPEDHMAFQ